MTRNRNEESKNLQCIQSLQGTRIMAQRVILIQLLDTTVPTRKLDIKRLLPFELRNEIRNKLAHLHNNPVGVTRRVEADIRRIQDPACNGWSAPAKFGVLGEQVAGRLLPAHAVAHDEERSALDVRDRGGDVLQGLVDFTYDLRCSANVAEVCFCLDGLAPAATVPAMYLDGIIGGQLSEEGVVVITAVTEAMQECNMGFWGFGGLEVRLVACLLHVVGWDA